LQARRRGRATGSRNRGRWRDRAARAARAGAWTEGCGTAARRQDRQAASRAVSARAVAAAGGEVIHFEHGEPHVQVTRWTLPCGLDVIVDQDHSVPQACVSIWNRAGSSDERAGLTGFAHLFEHLFKNSLHMPAHHYDVLRRAGASEANASTSSDRTAYHEVVPSNELALALWLESDRMGYFWPGMTAERLSVQQSVVRSERRQRYENVPYGEERFALAELMYPEGHPHRYLTIGLHDHIQGATMSDVEQWYRTWYVPANATLVLAGDIELAAARALVDRYFGSFPASTRAAPGSGSATRSTPARAIRSRPSSRPIAP